MPDTTRPAPPCLRILALKGYAEQVPSGSAVHENSGAGEGFAVRVPSLVASRFAARVRLADLHGTVAPSSKDHVGVAAGEQRLRFQRIELKVPSLGSLHRSAPLCSQRENSRGLAP